MSIQTSDINAIPDYSAADQLRAWKKASVDVALGGTSYAVGGRSLTRANAGEIRDMITFWQQQVNEEDGTGSIALAEFGDAR